MTSFFLTRARILDARARVILRPAIPLVTRVMLGHAFLLTGWGKLAHLERTTSFFANLGLPFAGFHAAFVGCIELVGGACLILGFGIRVVTSLLMSTMVVALATADRSSLVHALGFRGQPGFLDITALAFLVLLVWLFVEGAGAASLDGFVRSRKRGEVRSAA
ncbi:MAG: DoxX family protein [Planctomycetes bacterium]|nr:DoxX family protein [Planctomycetota bacterium]